MKVLVLDTETLGLKDRRVYNLGYVIYDTADGTTLKRDYLVKQVYDNQDLMNSAYYKDKKPLYEKKLADGNCKKCYWGSICNILKNDIERYTPDGIYAYNSRFDDLAIKETCKQYNAKVNPTADGILDIMNYIDSITQTEDYQKFCESNGYKTKHRPPRNQIKAETLYRYLIGQTDYQEEHTALADSEIELSILLVALGLALV